MRRVLILGSTGSIGTQALELVRAHPDLFRVVGLTAGGGWSLFYALQSSPRWARTGLGGLWLFVCARQLKSRALVPYKDPYFKEAIYGAH